MDKEELFSLTIKKPDAKIRELSKNRWDKIAKPVDALGEFEELICRIASIQGRLIPDTEKKALIIMCADNGVVKEGVSQTDAAVTCRVASLMGRKKSSVGVMTAALDMETAVYDIAIDSADTPEGVINRKIRRGTESFLKSAAFEESEALEAISTGIEAVRLFHEKGIGLIATGEMGIGNTTTGTALLCAICAADPAQFTGRGAGLKDDAYKRKTEVIEEGLRFHLKEKYGEGISSKEEMLRILCCLGGLDIAGLAGVFIGGAVYGVPIVIDGLISAAAALTADMLVPGCREYMLASHMGREGAMQLAMEKLSLKPVICGDMALGEGSGAVMLFPLIDMAAALYRNGTMFEDTAIEQYERYDK